jgi:lipoprotein-anchoring transpeptidase ErfK/SrfK
VTISSAAAAGVHSYGIAAMFPSNGQTVGVGMPVRVEFKESVPESERAAVEKAMTVTTTPQIPGAWAWLNSSTADYRPQGFWPAGTKVSVDAAVGSYDRTLDFTIGPDHEVTVNLLTHRMDVYSGGSLLYTFPTGGGKPGFDTDDGTMTVLSKSPAVEMTSCSIGLSCTPGNANYYDLIADYAVRLTPRGIFVHQAQWDNEIGTANNSHGCIHLNSTDAPIFYDFIRYGDPVTTTGSPTPATPLNGFGDYTVSWSSWLAKSALGVQTG